MLELAITQGADFLAYSRNAKVIPLPDGTTVLGPLSHLPHHAGDYTIRAVVLSGVEPGPLEIGGTAPPVVDGDVVVIRRTVTPMGADQIAAIEAIKRESLRGQIAEGAQASLTASDVTLIRCVEADVPVPAAWRAYRAALRAVIRGESDNLPDRPAYPEGT